MKMFKKYEFDSKLEAQKAIDDLGAHDNDIVELGYLKTADGVYAEDWSVLTPPVLSDKYSVDVIWNDKKDKDWKSKRIKLNGKENSHSFMGWDYSDNTI